MHWRRIDYFTNGRMKIDIALFSPPTTGLFYRDVMVNEANHFKLWTVLLLWRSSSKDGEIIKHRYSDQCRPSLEDKHITGTRVSDRRREPIASQPRWTLGLLASIKTNKPLSLSKNRIIIYFMLTRNLMFLYA